MIPSDPLDAARALGRELAQDAGRVEREGVERATLDRLAAAGLYGLVGPAAAGGSEVPVMAYRQVAECLSGADGNTWLVWFQHHPVVKMLAASPNTALVERHLPGLCAGSVQAGVAFSHLRNPSPMVTATPDGPGWRFSGTQPWCTGWGLIDVVLVGAATDEEVLFALVPAHDRPALRSTGELPLAAMAGTRTVALALDGLAVGADDLVLRMPRTDWLAADHLRSASVQPSVFGIAAAARAELCTTAPDIAVPLGERLQELRARAYRLADEGPPDTTVDQRLSAAAEAILLGVEITSALVTSLGGKAMALSHPAQRWAREAMFHLVFAQTGALRATTLATLGQPRSRQ
ncbi:MAG TPA: acyl-CoA dehydrogenase family protein [Acidimicrobiales bacterium]|nr:acyl-CoA dehydrogenase family protein [Acidimicrobiales bacterium]